MICNVKRICNMMGFSVSFFGTIFATLASDVQPLEFGGKTSLFEEKWTAEDLATLARTNKLAAAVTRLTSAKFERGAPALDVQGVQDAIDAAGEEGIQTALLKVADGKGGRKEDPLAAFAGTTNAAATCEISGTAGADGLDVCVDRCERKSSWLNLRTPRSGACYLLCSHAITPCVKGLFSLGTSAKTWGVRRERWTTSAKKQVVKQSMKVSTVLADLSVWVFAAWDALRASKLFLLMFAIAVAKDLWTAKVNSEDVVKEANKEAKRIKLKRLAKTRARLRKKEGFYALHDYGAWAIYGESVKAAKDERRKASCRLLGGLVSGRSKRAMATHFVRWQGVTAAVSAAAVDATDGEDRGAG